MNERIEQLLQNKPVPIGSIGNWGRVEWAYNVYPQLSDKLYAGVDLQKFAELIVQECASMARVYCSHEFDFTGDLELDEFMLKHFGIKYERTN
jgi:hypothetical protein